MRSDDLRFCASGCCHFVNNQPATQSIYELAARAYQSICDLPWPMETLIPCRTNAGKIQYAVEHTVGFYLGLRVPRTTGMQIVGTTSHLVFDTLTGKFLRVATDLDLRRWNVAHREALKAAKNISDRMPSLLQTPFGQSKS
jgi:hypothetical protein